MILTLALIALTVILFGSIFGRGKTVVDVYPAPVAKEAKPRKPRKPRVKQPRK
jgi:hypothetical protein